MEPVQPLPILQNGDPQLRAVAKLVPAELFGTDELKRIIAQMAVTLDGQPDGVALAAPQVGIAYRMFVVRYDRVRKPDENDVHDEDARATDEAGAPAARPPSSASPDLGIFINPSFVNSSRRRVGMEEGCLSVRGLYGTTLRHERATIRAQDIDGQEFERGGGGLVAQIYQHETDHLDGILFIDHAEHIVLVRKRANGEGYEEVPVDLETLQPIEDHSESN